MKVISNMSYISMKDNNGYLFYDKIEFEKNKKPISVNNELYMMYFDSNQKPIGIIPLISPLEKILLYAESIVNNRFSNVLPTNIYEIEGMNTIISQNLAKGFQVRETVEFLKIINYLPEETMEQYLKVSDIVTKTVDSQVSMAYHLAPLWVGQSVDGMKYLGENPYHLFSRQNYATDKTLGDMSSSGLIDSRNIVRSLTMGEGIKLDDVCRAITGKEKMDKIIESENAIAAEKGE